MLVLDTSATAPFLLADERQDRLPEVVVAVGEGNCIAPAIWSWEVANLLWKVLRSRRVKESELTLVLRDIEDLGISIDTDSVAQALGSTLLLAKYHDLTAYDAAYLELALRMNADLATFDADLRKAAIAEGIRIYPAP